MTEEVAKANSLYRQAQVSHGVSRALKRNYLEKAIIIYNRQMAKTKGNDTRARSSLFKNIAMSNLKLADVVDSVDELSELRLITYHLKEAVTNFSSSLFLRRNEKDLMTSEWGAGVQQRILDSFEISFRRAAGGTDKVNERLRSSILDALFQGIPADPFFDTIRASCHLAKAQYFYRRSVVSLEQFDFRSATQFLEYSREETEETKKSNQNPDNVLIGIEIRVIEDEIHMQRCCCDSVRVRCQADKIFQDEVMESEEMNIEMMWNVLDMYNYAITLAKEKDIENEALAVSRLGRVYYKIFKMKCRAHKYYRHALDLAQTLLPRDLYKLDWYRETTEYLEEYQQNSLVEQQRREEAEKAPVLEKFKAQLSKLKDLADDHGGSDTVLALLKHIYSTYPPKVKYEFDEKKFGPSKAKEFLMKAITHYHPDRQANFEFEWKVLCGEITKYLTVRYEQCKGV